ncbi:MAG: hypothetical protein EHM58_09460 [Ignavibacteriae bacterium]|nr:MAG: hypothetical protein EHM58_09460 [Ignavibacteriota bacterium]
MSASYVNEPGKVYPPDKYRRNTALYIALAVLGLLLVILIAYLALSRESKYETGMEYLQAKDYNSALAEFQDISPKDNDFRRAQNKINYIYGVKSFNDGNFDEAKIYLTKVEPSDEYYNESKLMLEKIASNVREDELQTQLSEAKNKKDTVIIKEKEPANTGGNTPIEKPPVKNTDEEISKKYITQVESLINKFQTTYQSSENASVESKRNYVSNMSSIMSQLNSLSYNANEKNALVIDLKSTAARWMSKRIEFINKLISENSVGVTNTTRSSKEEGDKLYNMTNNQLTKTKGFYNK